MAWWPITVLPWATGKADLKGYVQTASIKHHPGKDVIDAAITRIGKQLAIRDAFEFIETMLSRQERLAGHQRRHPRRRQLLQNPACRPGASCSKRWRLCRQPGSSAKGSAQCHRTGRSGIDPRQPGALRPDPAHRRADQDRRGINEAAAQVKRERALNSIDAKIAEVVKSLDQVQAAADLRNKALHPLQELKTKVAGLSSIPKILYLQEQAGICSTTRWASSRRQASAIKAGQRARIS
jgi:hypothetical protein